jgi:hypothetical protein
MAQYPSSIISFPVHVNGQVIDAVDVNSPDNEITAIQSFVGTQSSTFGITYDLRSPNSGGGGHVQTANKGGTGQISYNKGDLLVATSSSVLAKLGAGTDGQALIVNSSVAAGVNWGTVIANLPYSQGGGTGSVYTASPASSIVALTIGQVIPVTIPTANTVAIPAISVSGLLAVPIKNVNGNNLEVGQLRASMIALFGYTGSVMQVLNISTAIQQYSVTGSILTYAGGANNSQNTTLTKVKQLNIGYDWPLVTQIRTSFQLRSTNAAASVIGQVYSNSSAVGTRRVINSTSFVTYVEDINFNSGTDFELWASTSDGAIAVAYDNVNLLGTMALRPYVTCMMTDN